MLLRARSLLVVLLLVPACDDLGRALGLSDNLPARDVESPSESPEAEAEAEVELTAAELAYAAGRKYTMSCVFASLDEEKEAEASYLMANVAAARLNVELPPRPTKDDALDRMFDKAGRDAVAKEHGKEVGLAYTLGSKLTETTFGVGVGADVKPMLADVEVLAKHVPVPSSAWKAPLEATRASATTETSKALNAAFDTYFRYDEKPTGPAWSSTAKPAPASSPFVHTSADGRFSATFPFEPSETVETRDGVEWHKTSTEIDMYSVEWADYPDTAGATKALDVFVAGLKSDGGKHKEFKISGHPAHMVSKPIGESMLWIRTFVVDRRFYKVAVGNKRKPDRANAFLNSFALADS